MTSAATINQMKCEHKFQYQLCIQWLFYVFLGEN